MTLMLMMCLLLWNGVGEVYNDKVYTDKAKVEGLGEIVLPPGNWELERTELPTKPRGRHLFVFKKMGDRLERISFQKIGPESAGSLGSYFDGIGDSFSNGVPTRVGEKSEHDTAHFLGPVREYRYTDSKVTGMSSSYVYTGEKSIPWMSHACVTDQGGWVLISVHASPFALSPETIFDVVADSKFEKPTTVEKK